MNPWVEQYAPITLSDVPQPETKLLELYLSTFRKGKVLLIHGPTGSGKTASVKVLAREHDLELLEVNASDKRSAALIEETIGEALRQGSLFGRKKLIFIDELDGVSGTQDRGGIPTLAKLISTTPHYLIIAVNDAYDDKLSSIRKLCTLAHYPEVDTSAGALILSTICKKEGLTFDEGALRHLLRKNAGDLRSSITDLQLLASVNKHITMESMNDISDRDRTEELSQALTKVFKFRSLDVASTAFDLITEDTDTLFLWFEENIHREYTGTGLINATLTLALADRFKKRIQKQQYWRYLATINPLLSMGIALSKEQPLKTPPAFREPTRIFTAWRVKQERAKQEDMSSRHAQHSSVLKFRTETLPYLSLWMTKQPSLW